jgi:ketosteroid isomerase-like protein
MAPTASPVVRRGVAPAPGPAYVQGMTAAEVEALEANARFYAAFAARDARAMEKLWAERHPVACIHPGWDVLEGRERVLASWRGILGSPGAPDVTCSLAEAHLVGELAVVTCHEVLPGGRLAATNLYVREDGAWKLVHHQATPIAKGQARASPPRGPAN